MVSVVVVVLVGLACGLVLDTFALPHFAWYRQFRTYLFRRWPTSGQIVGYRYADGKWQYGRVVFVDRRANQVYVEQHIAYRLLEHEPNVWVRRVWYRPYSLTWFPWWTQWKEGEVRGDLNQRFN